LKTIGILVFSGAEELDFVGPFEVFGLAACCLKDKAKQNGLTMITASPMGKAIVGAHGLKVIPDCSLDNVPHLDVLVVPGGRGAREQMVNPKMLDFVMCRSRECELVTSVCTGALILAAAGLLTGKRATTHWAATEELGRFEGIQIQRKRYIHDGKIITSAGISAGIDMALYVTEHLFGKEIQNDVAKRLEYSNPQAGE